MERFNPACGHCGGNTIAMGLSVTGSIIYNCTRTGCRCSVAVSPEGTSTTQPCLTERRTGSCTHTA